MAVKQTLLFLAFLIGLFGGYNSVIARDYTTMDTGSKESVEEKDTQTAKENPKDEGPVCTKDDITAIQKFNKKAMKVKAEAKKLADEALKVTREDQAKSKSHEKLQEELLEVNKFYESEEYKAMRPVYERCNMALPQIVDIPFGLPPIR